MTSAMTGETRFIRLSDAYFKGWDYVTNKADALYPSLTNPDNKYYANSDYFLEDASFIKLKNISLSYRIPRRWAKIASIQLSVSAGCVHQHGLQGHGPRSLLRSRRA